MLYSFSAPWGNIIINYRLIINVGYYLLAVIAVIIDAMLLQVQFTLVFCSAKKYSIVASYR